MLSPQKRVFLLIVVGVLLPSAVFSALAAGNTSLAVTPSAAAAAVGFDTSVSVDVTSDLNVQGMDVQFSFDPAVLQAVDADGGAGGIQVAPGTCPAPDFVVVNTVDNGAGTGHYAAVEFVTNCSAGEVFSVTFTCIAEGVSPMTITSSTISDPNGVTIDHEVFDGSISCYSNNAIFIPITAREP